MSYLKLFLVAACDLFLWKKQQLLSLSPRPAPCVSVLFLSMLLMALSSFFTSCDKFDEPVLTVDYFFAVASKPPDYEPVPKSEMVYTITRIMKDSIRKVYPRKTVDGNDGPVINACDHVYRRYLEEHPEAAKYFYCEARLNRAQMRGAIVVSCKTVKRYSF